MNCPFCGGIMLTGYLQSGRPIIWSPEKKTIMFTVDGDSDRKVSTGFWNGSFADASVCPCCKKLIASLPE